MKNSAIKKKQHKQSTQRPVFSKVLQKSGLSFWAMAPLLLGVIGLVGLFQVLVTPKMLASLFRGNSLLDTLIGTLIGSIAAGNPIVSYLIGGELLGQGISLYAVSAFILSWVTLGFIQLPAEVEVFGGHFTLYRNILSFIFTMLIAALTTLTLQVLS
ncbi:MAG: permease [Desulfobulbaceae bacterium]|nr:permease [Desulfobulbaceae bacterium]